MSPSHRSPGLQREGILSALAALSERLGSGGCTGELCLFGGTVMVLAYQARVATKDVDALFLPSQEIRAAAQWVAAAQGLPADWLNDGVKGFLSAQHTTTEGNLPQFPHLHLTMPVPEYLLAMKCLAARLGGPGGEASDVPDIRFLISHLRLTTAAEVLSLVAQYYPPERLSVKTQYLVESLFDQP